MVVPYIIKSLPDMTVPETIYLASHLRPGARVWEWGSGGSTVFFLSQGCRVTAVEHIQVCAAILQLGLSQATQLAQLDLRVVPNVPGYVEGGVDDGQREHFAAYVDAYDGDPVDIFLVDGRARLACLERLREKAPPDAVVLLHDAGRYDYSPYAELIGSVDQLHRLRLKR